MKSTLAKNKTGLVALALLGYLSSYVILWGSREETLFALTDHGCFKRTREVRGLRFEWMQRSSLRTPVTAFYRPVNALLDFQSEWH